MTRNVRVELAQTGGIVCGLAAIKTEESLKFKQFLFVELLVQKK
jgi:hypothetical protein